MATNPVVQNASATLTGTLQNERILEASGLARSNRSHDLLWVINDGGSAPALHAVGVDGSDRGSVRLDGASNVDWEDLASFNADGKSWLLVADIGDNSGIREHLTLYLLEEPRQPLPAASAARQITFTYPDGPRDAEAVAVDVENARVLVLSKRAIPAVLYSIPLWPDSSDTIVAERRGEVSGIPSPTKRDVDRAAASNDWHWQPTGMDISADGRSAVVLTYRAIYRFHRDAGEDWLAALQTADARWPLGDKPGAEAVSFDASGDSVFVTIEQRNAPIYRFNISK